MLFVLLIQRREVRSRKEIYWVVSNIKWRMLPRHFFLIQHVCRSSNLAAHGLARLTLSTRSFTVQLEEVPLEISDSCYNFYLIFNSQSPTTKQILSVLNTQSVMILLLNFAIQNTSIQLGEHKTYKLIQKLSRSRCHILHVLFGKKFEITKYSIFFLFSP